MIAFFGKLWRNRRGNALAIAAACLPLFVGAAGLATDTIQWTLWKRQLQRAADSAAISGVYNREANLGATTTTKAAVAHDLSLNLHTFYSLKSDDPTNYPDCSNKCKVEFPTPASTYQQYLVKVTIAVQQPLTFSSMFMSTAPTIMAVSTAASVSSGGPACMQALETASTTGISNSGNTTVTAPTCILYSNSPSANSASAGGSSSITAKAVAAVGGIASSKNWHVTKYIPYSPPLPDPFANVKPGPMNCTSAAADKNTDWAAMKAAGINCFSSMSTQPHDTISVPNNFGPIYINGGSVDFKGDFSCTGCTIVLTNSSSSPTATIGTFTSNSQATNTITAPSSGCNLGTDGCFKGIAIYQDRRAANGNTNKVNGGSSNVIQGAVYFPKGVLQINGTGDAVSLCAMWVAKDIDLIGTSNIAISAPDDAACSGSGMPSPAAVHMVRLVA
jgi:hypothetical protein